MRELMKPHVTQWGLDPIWQTRTITAAPGYYDFPDRVAFDEYLTLDGKAPQVDVAGHEVHFDAERQLWFCRQGGWRGLAPAPPGTCHR
jgi:hypothetical protein